MYGESQQATVPSDLSAIVNPFPAATAKKGPMIDAGGDPLLLLPQIVIVLQDVWALVADGGGGYDIGGG